MRASESYSMSIEAARIHASKIMQHPEGKAYLFHLHAGAAE